jgi:integrase
VYPGQLLTLPGDTPIWISFSRRNQGQALGIRTISTICERYLGTSKTHAPRHTLAVAMHHKHAKITDIQKALGHSNPAITGMYLEEHLSYENPLAAELEEEFGID